MNKSPLGIRNNNPLNIRANGITWNGATDESSGYVVFESPFYGIRAAARILKTYREVHGLTTVSEIVSRWAPDSENNTQSYINHVCESLRVDKNESLPTEYYPHLMAVMILHENGEQPYSFELIEQGFEAGFYG